MGFIGQIARPACVEGRNLATCGKDHANGAVQSETERIMLHDTIMSRAMTRGRQTPGPDQAVGGCDDRRAADRVPFPGEMILLWHHDPALRHRHRVLDAGDGGYRIATSLPLLEGTTGMVLRLLPSDSASDKPQPVMVAWCCKMAGAAEDGGGGYEVGLRVF